MILAVFDLPVTPMLATKCRVSFSVQEKWKLDFQDGRLGFPIGTILASFDLKVTPMLPTKFRVNWPFGSGEEAKNRFSKWRPYWISDPNDFGYFWFTCHPNASYQVSSQLTQGCRRSRLLKQLMTPRDGSWLTTIAHLEHFVLRWPKKGWRQNVGKSKYSGNPCWALSEVMHSLLVRRGSRI